MIGNETNPPVKRRSIHERLSVGADHSVDIALTDPAQFANRETTSTFRIAATGELVVDQAASLPVAQTVSRLGLLEPLRAQAHHLLLLPEDVASGEVEALTISVWDESGWTGPGVLHLTEGAVLEGPWDVSDDLCASLGIPSTTRTAWVLVAEPDRTSPQAPELPASDWSRAFPAGMPAGTELKTLLVLARIARRLGGQVRIAGSGYLIAPDPESAVNLRVYSPNYLGYETVLSLLNGRGLAVSLPAGAPRPVGGAPYAIMVSLESQEKILVGVNLGQLAPRVLRWESWNHGPLCVYEINWLAALHGGEEPLTRRRRLDRRRAAETIEQIAAALVQHLGESAVIDEDDFLLDRAELIQASESPHP